MHALIEGSERLRGLALEERVELGIDGKENHFYSPQLVVRVRPEGDGAFLEARFGPDPYVWAFYVMGSGGLTVLTFFASMFGVGQWMVGQTPTALFVAPAAATLAGLVYGASYVGQGLGQDQMYFLRHSLEHTLDGVELEDEPKAST
ncbi:MAG: hypothetical protein K1X94_33015 [Sandaracinaceae bacterium]|jgi:hypothetical protein|nr:hypothetical protein [Sandaracinaceae bacterium]